MKDMTLEEFNNRYSLVHGNPFPREWMYYTEGSDGSEDWQIIFSNRQEVEGSSYLISRGGGPWRKCPVYDVLLVFCPAWYSDGCYIENPVPAPDAEWAYKTVAGQFGGDMVIEGLDGVLQLTPAGGVVTEIGENGDLEGEEHFFGCEKQRKEASQ